MPRKARVDAPGALHHIIVRGIERKPIFKDKIEYGNFIDRLGKVLVDTDTACFVWTFPRVIRSLIFCPLECDHPFHEENRLTCYDDPFPFISTEKFTASL